MVSRSLNWKYPRTNGLPVQPNRQFAAPNQYKTSKLFFCDQQTIFKKNNFVPLSPRTRLRSLTICRTRDRDRIFRVSELLVELQSKDKQNGTTSLDCLWKVVDGQGSSIFVESPAAEGLILATFPVTLFSAFFPLWPLHHFPVFLLPVSSSRFGNQPSPTSNTSKVQHGSKNPREIFKF